MASGLTMSGIPEMQGKLRKIAQNAPTMFGDALLAEMQIELREVQRRTPVDTGALIASERLEGPFIQGKTIVVLMLAGGGNVDYAVRVHEDLEAFHATGQAKFMESVLLESRAFIGARVAKRMNLGDLL